MNHPLFDKLQELADQHELEPVIEHDLEPDIAPKAKPKVRLTRIRFPKLIRVP